MRDKSGDPFPKRLKEWFKGARERGTFLNGSKAWASSLEKRVPKKLKDLDFDFKKIQLKNVSQYSGWIRWGLLVLALFLLSEVASRSIGLFIRPSYLPVTKKSGGTYRSSTPMEDYDAILRRNMFNVEGKIPDAFEQGQLDCMSQARASTQRIVLLGTIVMNDESLSVALIQDENNPVKIGVKKDEVFFEGKYQALKVDRKRLCFQVRATQEFEYVEIPDDSAALGATAPSLDLRASEGITPVSETEYVIKQNFLEKNLLNLNEILQTARAVPYVEPGSGKFRGFLIQSIDSASPFSQLGIKQGDILTGVNDIVLDNAGKGLEAFQRLRNSPKVSLEIIRGGQKTTVSYDVK